MRNCLTISLMLIAFMCYVTYMDVSSAIASSANKYTTNSAVGSVNKNKYTAKLLGTYYGEYVGPDGYVPRYRLEFRLKRGKLIGVFHFVDTGIGDRGPDFKMVKLQSKSNKLLFTTEQLYVSDGHRYIKCYFTFKGNITNRNIIGKLTQHDNYTVTNNLVFDRE